MSEQRDVTTVTRVMGRCPSCNQELSGEIDLVVKTDKPFLHPDGTPKVRAEAYRCGMRLNHSCGPDDLPPTFADVIQSLFGTRENPTTPHPPEQPVPHAGDGEGRAS